MDCYADGNHHLCAGEFGIFRGRAAQRDALVGGRSRYVWQQDFRSGGLVHSDIRGAQLFRWVLNRSRSDELCWANWFICAWVMFAFFTGGVNGVIFTSARLFATGAQDGNLPSFFSLVHYTQQTPIPSLIFSVSGTNSECLARGVRLYRKLSFLRVFFSSILAVNLAGHVVYVERFPVDQLLQPNLMAIGGCQHRGSVMDA